MLSTYHFRTDFEESRAGVDEDLEQIEKSNYSTFWAYSFH